MWIPTKGELARPTGNQCLPVRKFVSPGANFRVFSFLAQNPQILRDRSCEKRPKEKEGFGQAKYLAESFFSGIIKLQ